MTVSVSELVSVFSLRNVTYFWVKMYMCEGYDCKGIVKSNGQIWVWLGVHWVSGEPQLFGAEYHLF